MVSSPDKLNLMQKILDFMGVHSNSYMYESRLTECQLDYIICCIDIFKMTKGWRNPTGSVKVKLKSFLQFIYNLGEKLGIQYTRSASSPRGKYNQVSTSIVLCS